MPPPTSTIEPLWTAAPMAQRADQPEDGATPRICVQPVSSGAIGLFSSAAGGSGGTGAVTCMQNVLSLAGWQGGGAAGASVPMRS